MPFETTQGVRKEMVWATAQWCVFQRLFSDQWTKEWRHSTARQTAEILSRVLQRDTTLKVCRLWDKKSNSKNKPVTFWVAIEECKLNTPEQREQAGLQHAFTRARKTAEKFGAARNKAIAHLDHDAELIPAKKFKELEKAIDASWELIRSLYLHVGLGEPTKMSPELRKVNAEFDALSQQMEAVS